MENEWVRFTSVDDMARGEYLIRCYDPTTKTFTTRIASVNVFGKGLFEDNGATRYSDERLKNVVAYKSIEPITNEADAEFMTLAIDPVSRFGSTVEYARFSINSLGTFEWKRYGKYCKPTKSGQYICITRQRRFNCEYAYVIEFETYKEKSDKWYFLTICEGNDLCNDAIETRIDENVVYYASITNSINLPDDIKEVVINEQD